MTKLRLWDINGQLITIQIEADSGIVYVIYPN